MFDTKKRTMSKTRSPAISINFLPVVTDKGDWFGDQGIAAKFVGEIAKGCAELLQKLGALGTNFEVIKVNFRKQTENSKRLRISLQAVFNVVGRKMECDTIFETESHTDLAEQVTDNLGFEVGLKLRSLQKELESSTTVLGKIAPFAFQSPYKP